MVTLRTLRTYTLRSLDDVGRALAFLERSVQDALDQLSNEKDDYISVLRTDKSTDSASYNQHVFSSGSVIELPAASSPGEYVAVSNIGSGSLSLKTSASDTVMGASTYTLASHATIHLTSDGLKGWW